MRTFAKEKGGGIVEGETLQKTLWNGSPMHRLRVVSYVYERMKRKKDTNLRVYQAVR
jgi:hypothetical protein